MQYLTVMATLDSKVGAEFEGYKLNPGQIISIRDLGSYPITIPEVQPEPFLSPIAEIKMPGLTFFASGVAEELLARIR